MAHPAPRSNTLVRLTPKAYDLLTEISQSSAMPMTQVLGQLVTDAHAAMNGAGDAPFHTFLRARASAATPES